MNRNLMNANKWKTINQTKQTGECRASKKLEEYNIHNTISGNTKNAPTELSNCCNVTLPFHSTNYTNK